MSASRNSRRRIQRFVSDAAAATAVEFATLAPVFFGVIFFTCQISLYFYYSATLSHAANTAARKIMTGAVSATPNLTAALFRTKYLCPLLPPTVDCSSVITNIFTIPATGTFYGLPEPVMDNTRTSFCIGKAGDYVMIQVFYPMPVLGIRSMLPGSTEVNGKPSDYINANVVFTNEPYASSYSGC